VLIKVADLERDIRAAIADIEQGMFATPPATLEDLRHRVGRRQGLNDALEIIAAIVKEEDDEE
jgi:hypothetical protein